MAWILELGSSQVSQTLCLWYNIFLPVSYTSFSFPNQFLQGFVPCWQLLPSKVRKEDWSCLKKGITNSPCWIRFLNSALAKRSFVEERTIGLVYKGSKKSSFCFNLSTCFLLLFFCFLFCFSDKTWSPCPGFKHHWKSCTHISILLNSFPPMSLYSALTPT